MTEAQMERVATYIRHEHGTTIQVYTGPCNQVAALRDLYLGTHPSSRVTFVQWNTGLDRAQVEITDERCVRNA